MNIWYKSILGIAAAIFLFIGIPLLILLYFEPNNELDYGGVVGQHSTLLGIFYLIFYFIVKHHVVKKAWHTIFSILVLLMPFVLYNYVLYPDRTPSKKIVYVLPENFSGRFTINFMLKKEDSDELVFTDTAIIYYIPPNGMFKSTYPMFTTDNEPSCYRISNHKLIKIKSPNFWRSFTYMYEDFKQDSSLYCFFADAGFNNFLPVGYLSYIADYPYNLCTYADYKEELKRQNGGSGFSIEPGNSN